jgi:hypothetical protein
VADVAELTAVYIGPTQLLVLVHVVPVDGTELTTAIRRLRHRLLAVPAIAAIEVTPVARPHPARRTEVDTHTNLGVASPSIWVTTPRRGRVRGGDA